MELTVRSAHEVQTLRCSLDGNHLVAEGEWNISTTTHITEPAEVDFGSPQRQPYNKLDEKFTYNVQNLERFVYIGDIYIIEHLVKTTRSCVRFGLHVQLDNYVEILLRICRSEAMHSLRCCVFEALLEVMEFQGQDFPIELEARSKLITCILDFFQCRNGSFVTMRVCFDILQILAVNTTECFAQQGRIGVIFKILNRSEFPKISEYILRLVKVLLEQPGFNDSRYFEDVLPILHEALESSNGIVRIIAAGLYSELAQNIQYSEEFMRKLTSGDIVKRICYLLTHTQDRQNPGTHFEQILGYLPIVCNSSPDLNIYCLINQTLCSILTGSEELPNGEFQLVLNAEDWELGINKVTDMLCSLSSDHQERDSDEIEDEYRTKISEVITCLFRISQKMFLSPSCDWASKLYCLENFRLIINCKWCDFDILLFPFMKCNDVIQHMIEALWNIKVCLVAESVSAINTMLKVIPHIVTKPFSMFQLHKALDRCIFKYEVLTEVSKTQRIDEENESYKRRNKVVRRLKKLRRRFCNLTMEGIDGNPTTLFNCRAALKNIIEQKELILIRKVIVDDKITPYMILDTKLVPALLYFLIGVDDIIGALNFHHSDLRIGPEEKIIRNNRIKKFLNIFLGCETDGSCPSKATNKEPFVKLINLLQSALPIVANLNSATEFRECPKQVQKLLLHKKSNENTSLEVIGPENMLDLYLIPHFDQPYVVDDPSSGIISLLNVLYGINEHYGDLYPPGSFNTPLPQEQFVNNYVTDTLVKFTGRADSYENPFDKILPLHLWKTLFSCPFMVEFKRRLEIFKKLIRHWDSKMHCFQTQADVTEHQEAPGAVFSVNRNNIIEESEQYFTSSLVLSRAVEVNFKGELGAGGGPTQEFYTVISNEFQNTKFNLWRGDTSLADQLDGDRSKPNYVAASHGLYPKPISGHSSTENNVVAQKFELLGKIIAKALVDGKVLDLNLNDSFTHIFLRREQCMGMTELYKLDPQLAKSLTDLKSLLDESHRSQKITNVSPSHVQQKSFRPELDRCSIDELCLDFILPGYPEIVLKKDGGNAKVNIDNLDEYIRLVIQWTLQAGVSRQVEAIRKGFSRILPVELLRMFSSKELQIFFSGNSENQNLHLRKWIENADYLDYDKTSPVVKFLLEIVSDYDPLKQKFFIQFVTGAPRIPIDGNPDWKLRLCRSDTNNGNKADEVIPTAMTCTRALYLPEYSNKEIMREKLDLALQEGLNSFQMS